MPDSEPSTDRPWSSRRPQNFVLSAILIALAIALVLQGFAYIRDGLGGLVPYLMVIVAPLLAAYYVWFFTIRKFDAE